MLGFLRLLAAFTFPKTIIAPFLFNPNSFCALVCLKILIKTCKIISVRSRGGGIGRRSGLKIRRSNPCGFESHPRHYLRQGKGKYALANSRIGLFSRLCPYRLYCRASAQRQGYSADRNQSRW